MGWTLAFAAVAVFFVLITGANDGATLTGFGLRVPRTPGRVVTALLVAVLFAGPYVLGVAVARTFTEGLAGLALGYLLGAGARRVPSHRRMPRLVRAAHLLAYAARCAAVFLAGALTSFNRVGERLGRGLISIWPLHVVSAEAAATGAVLAGSALGSPVSMTQSVTAGVVGVVASEGSRRVRWQGVLNVGTAWLLTLPSSMALGCLSGLALRLP
ncbi:inorganic phosphate transporter [Nonomuraea zeae]|uniref:Inorganic phosphate transporter n=1 Tax=Nonomuraea zeae TaxID=1642303 RepID=A0A5S4FEQ7_9ACTN|nr:inorganic phosphate transporter [Nonomuraea zeae]TMR16971.1 inorganic phosphate transporter [Nonomuraea zeae]